MRAVNQPLPVDSRALVILGAGHAGAVHIIANEVKQDIRRVQVVWLERDSSAGEFAKLEFRYGDLSR